jgi:hypothetical protein
MNGMTAAVVMGLDGELFRDRATASSGTCQTGAIFGSGSMLVRHAAPLVDPLTDAGSTGVATIIAYKVEARNQPCGMTREKNPFIRSVDR